MSDEMDAEGGKPVYQDEVRFVSWLKFVAGVEAHGEPEEDDEVETERKWSDFVIPQKDFMDIEVIRDDEKKGTTMEFETEPVTQHDWTGSETVMTYKSGGSLLIKHSTPVSKCKKPLDKCTMIGECTHTETDVWWEQVPAIRQEFRDSGFSIADRPTENFFLGLPGLRWIETGQLSTYLRVNKMCKSCNIYTPKNLDTCQNCDKVLV